MRMRSRTGFERYFEKPTSLEEEELLNEVDQLKEEMSIFASDIDLLAWAQEKVLRPFELGQGEKTDAGKGIESDAAGRGFGPEESSTKNEVAEITFHRTYPRILAHLIKTLRDNYNNPHLALALFRQAQTHSLESYLSGCQTSTYNELLKTRWEALRDFAGLVEGVQEMRKHGVNWDKDTAKIVSGVVEEVGGEMVTDKEGSRRRYGDDVLEKVGALDRMVHYDLRVQEGYEEKVARDKRFYRRTLEREHSRSSGYDRSRQYQHD